MFPYGFVSFSPFILLHNPIFFIGLMTLLGIANGIVTPPIFSIISRCAPQGKMGEAIGSYEMFASFGFACDLILSTFFIYIPLLW
ncbi:hypothetical protein [Archaeoglobus sulfaticallidus]|uniref:hypothetical protein n=1 Tax=Archaeoglobus sulfaticallidus TaxID=1316941 RepID=UPI00373AF422